MIEADKIDEMFRDFVVSAVETGLLNRGYMIERGPAATSADIIARKPGGKPFALEFKKFTKGHELDLVKAKDKIISMSGRTIPMYYVGFDSHTEKVAARSDLTQELKGIVPGLNFMTSSMVGGKTRPNMHASPTRKPARANRMK